MLAASAFSDPDPEDTHAASWWLVADNADFSSPEWDSGAAAPATRVQVPAGLLSPGMQYYWRVKYRDAYGFWSPWATTWVFTTFENDTGPGSQPAEEPEPAIVPNEILLPGCGAGICGAGFLGAMPLTILGLCCLKLQVRCVGRKRR